MLPLSWLEELGQLPIQELLDQRYRKFRGMGDPGAR